MMDRKIYRAISLLLLVVILAWGIFFRFYRLNWDQGHYLHPDERLYINSANISWPKSVAEFLSPQSPLNPHMFYYGSPPLYLYVFFFRLVNRLWPEVNSLLVFSRFVSAVISSITIYPLYLLSRKFLSPAAAVVSTLLFVFSIGSIQHAHYNTTESWLIFFAVWLGYLSVLLVEKFKLGLALAAGSVLGLAGASKITGWSLAIIPATTFLIDRKKILWRFLLLIFIAGIVSLIAAPYNLIDFPSFRREQEYMQGVTVGKYKPPFIIIYENTVPYLYQLTKIWPFIFTPTALLASLVGLTLIIYLLFRNFRGNNKFLLLLTWPVIYFLAAGSWYAKFSRYMVILLPFFSICAGFAIDYLISRKRYVKLGWGLGIFLAIVQIYFATTYVKEIYGRTHTRIAASQWIYQNIPAGSVIAIEHWDDGLPLSITGKERNIYKYIELKVYDEETSEKKDKILQQINQADYLILSSRRVWYSIVRNADKYPFMSNFYQNLFTGNAGFELIHEERRLDDDFTDETYQSYDHPPVYIFQKL